MLIKTDRTRCEYLHLFRRNLTKACERPVCRLFYKHHRFDITNFGISSLLPIVCFIGMVFNFIKILFFSSVLNLLFFR